MRLCQSVHQEEGARPARWYVRRLGRTAKTGWLAAAIVALVACGDGRSSSDGAESSPLTAFRDAVAARDLDALIGTFADDIRLYSPVLSDPFVGRDRVARLFGVLVNVFQDIQIENEFRSNDRYALAFHARVASEEVLVVDLLRFDAEGKIEEFVVTMRTLPGIQALAAAVAPHLPEINGASNGD
jgi:hypothetical protein